MQSTETKIIEIIKENFPNGIRDDFIDINKVRRLYLESHANEDNLRDIISYIIRRDGIADGERFYFISDADIQQINRLVDGILEKHSVVFYTSIYERYADFFKYMHIFSIDVLKKILQSTNGARYHTKDFCSARKTRLDHEISKAFMLMGHNLSVEDLQQLFPYVPTEKIVEQLDDTQKYFPTVDDKFMLAYKIKFDLDEIHDAKRQISLSIDAKGYADFEDFTLESNFALNPEIDEKILRNLIFQKFFAADFSQRSKQLFKKSAANARKPRGLSDVHLRKFIDDQEELSADKLFDFAKELGAVNWMALNVAFETMVRVSKNLFVKDALIDFDVEGVDEALAPFIKNKIIPLRAVNSFTGFPAVGAYSWNLFLLESFLRKFSRRYSYDSPAANSSNAGAIYPQSMQFKDYIDVQAAAVVQENIPIESSAIENFLIGQGYRAARNVNSINKIIARSKDFLSR